MNRHCMIAVVLTLLLLPLFTAVPALASPPCNPPPITGSQRALVIAVTYPDEPAGTLTLNDIRTRFFGPGPSLAQYWSEVSYGRFTLTGDVLGWYSISLPATCGLSCPADVMTAALAAAAPYTDLTQYNYIYFVENYDTLPNHVGRSAAACTKWPSPQGELTFGEAFMTIASGQPFPQGAETHEAGHALWLGHANMRSYGTQSIGPLGGATQGALYEYDDAWDPMGTGVGGPHYNANNKYFLGWLTNNDIFRTTHSGTFTIQPLSSPLTGRKAVRVFRGVDTTRYSKTDPNSLFKEYFWVETRQSIGYDNNSGTYFANAFGRAVLHYQHALTLNGAPPKQTQATEVIDTHPTNSGIRVDVQDAPLSASETFTDPYTNLRITHQGTDAAGNLTVGVTYDPNWVDSDEDGISDVLEAVYGSNPNLADTTGSGLSDLFKVCYDGDCRTYKPYPNGGDLDLTKVDTDGDGTSDYAEIIAGRNSLGNELALTISAAGDGTGTVTSSPAGINCGTTCSKYFFQGPAYPGTVTLTASPASGSVFSGWSGGCSGTGTCTLTVQQASVAVTANFNIVRPTITSFTPTSGTVGTIVTITGTNLTIVDKVLFNNTAAQFQVVGATQLTATVPAGATSAPIALFMNTNPTWYTTSSQKFTVPPTITSLSPSSGPVGTFVTINGDLYGTTQVAFNGVAASFQRYDSSTVMAIVPSGAKTGYVTVTNAAGTGTSSQSFTVTPSITQLSPSSGPVGTLVTISGYNLKGATQVAFNGKTASFQIQNATTILALVPAGATTGSVTVTTPAGTATSPQAFTVTPSITQLTPSSGPVGTLVTVSGYNLKGATRVAFNGKAASFQIQNATTILALVPAGATTGSVTVTTPAGTATSPQAFTVK